MGTEVAIALALAAASAGATYYNNQQTAKRQDRQLASQLRADAAKQRQADEQTANLINKTRQSTDADEKASSLASFTQAIKANQANANRPLATLGNVSEAYKQSGSDAALGMAGKAAGLADLISSIDAPTQQRQNDVRDVDNYRTQIGLIQRASRGDDFLSQMKLARIKRNPWIDAFAGITGGAAANYGGGSSTGSTPNTYSFGDGYTYNLPSY
jgi:hypothetical protein